MWASDTVKKIYGEYKPTNRMKWTLFKCYELSIGPMLSIFNNAEVLNIFALIYTSPGTNFNKATAQGEDTCN